MPRIRLSSIALELTGPSFCICLSGWACLSIHSGHALALESGHIFLLNHRQIWCLYANCYRPLGRPFDGWDGFFGI